MSDIAFLLCPEEPIGGKRVLLSETDGRSPAAADTRGETAIAFKALALNCTLKAEGAEPSSTDAMIAVLEKAFGEKEVTISETVRVAALDIKPCVTSDEGEGDDWPELRAKIFGGPI